jgi:hypothetical protein
VRKTLNDNPMIAIGVVAVLGLGVALMLMSSLSKGGTTPPTDTTTTSAPGTTATVPATGTAAPPATSPATSSSAPSATSSSAGSDLGAFQAGAGLPKAVVDAYDHGDIVALLVLKRNGIDDRAVQAAVHRIQKAPNVAVFQTYAQNVARFSRIAEGVDLNRVPAMVVMRPRHLSKGTPTATVTYGFGSEGSIGQAFRDAAYKGPDHLPFYPR